MHYGLRKYHRFNSLTELRCWFLLRVVPQVQFLDRVDYVGVSGVMSHRFIFLSEWMELGVSCVDYHRFNSLTEWRTLVSLM